MDFGELKNDTNFVNKITELDASLKEIDEQITKCIEFPYYDKLTIEEKVKFDLYLSYTMNSLYYMYVKLQGMDPNTHGIKNEISRVRQSMLREKQIYENKTLRPTLDKEAAGRFIKHGIHYRKDRNDREEQIEDEEQNQDDNDSNGGRFVRLNQSIMEAHDENSFSNENNTLHILSDDSENDEPTAKKNRKTEYIISDDSDLNQKPITKTKKKRKRKSIPIN